MSKKSQSLKRVSPVVSIGLAASEPFQIVPRLLRIPEAAHYIGGTNWCVEELVRGKRIPFIVVGKYRVIDIRDLDAWIDAEKKVQLARAIAA
jgi:excisionase family DNA binding protein